MITGHSDVQMVVEAMKAGASDFIEKPVNRPGLTASVERALDQGQLLSALQSAASRIAGLTPRQRQILDIVLAGRASKIIAADLGLSQRTVENHRAQIMQKPKPNRFPH
jgi:two-component system, chemotaxis family, CheB/CheR fusion protein